MYSRRSIPPGGPSFLNTMASIDMTNDRPTLPLDITAKILSHLPIPDLLHCARASRRLRDMVYDDTRWVARLQSMGVWDEAAARRHYDDVMRKRREAAERAAEAQRAAVVAGQPTTLFDAAAEEEEQARRLAAPALQPVAVPVVVAGRGIDGFQTLSISGEASAADAADLLDVLTRVKSVRGRAREEFGKIYGVLAPLYNDLVRSKSHTDPVVFKVFRDPERQARMLANLRTFSKCDWAAGALEREERVMAMMGIFESAVLREFEQGYEFWDVDGRMKRYANVLHLLNGGAAGVTLFVEKHPLFSDATLLQMDALECLNRAIDGSVELGPAHGFFETLLGHLNEQAGVIERIFPKPVDVFWAFVDKARDDLMVDYITPLFDDAHEQSIEAYLKVVSGVYEQCVLFFRSLRPPGIIPFDSPDQEATKRQKVQLLDIAKKMTWRLFEPHLYTYLQEELDFFDAYCGEKVEAWERKLSEQEASVESFLMGNFTNRQADKKDFMSSFKKVVMMPVSVLPTFTFTSSTTTGKNPETTTTESTPGTIDSDITPATHNRTTSLQQSTHHRDSTASQSSLPPRSGTPSLPPVAPTDELAAKAALMASRLENIKSLFSMEMALDLIAHAKVSIGRAAVFIPLGGQAGGEAREQCQAIFAALVRHLGARHMNDGFSKATKHLAAYNPRETTGGHEAESGVAPLVMFIELVNVGDLISQMIDVFYEQQLVAPKIVDKNDFLDAAAKAKKTFEKLLDENVAAGLNKGIDVLMDEVEYLNATTQAPTDYNPLPDLPDIPGTNTALSGTPGGGGGGGGKRATIMSDATGLDIGPTTTALRIVDLVSRHTAMLIGTTDKSMLDVFNGEVGLRLFTAVCKHLKRQRISTAGAVKLIADMNAYWGYIQTLKNADLQAYFGALRELSQIYLIDGRHAKEMAAVIADGDRFGGIFRAEEVYEFAQRRADWYSVKKDVERAMYGLECVMM